MNICGSNQVILVFLHGDRHQGKVAPETTTFWFSVACCVSHPIRLKDFLISNEAKKNQ